MNAAGKNHSVNKTIPTNIIKLAPDKWNTFKNAPTTKMLRQMMPEIKIVFFMSLYINDLQCCFLKCRQLNRVP